MPEYKLIYFDIMGRAEIIRWIFAYANIPYTDERISWADWPKLKPEMPFGKVPVLMIDGKPLVQSLAIARYLAKETGLHPKDSLNGAYCDALADTMEDLFKILEKIKHEEMNEDLQRKTKEEVIPNNLVPVLNKLTKQLEGREWFVTFKVTWADFLIAIIAGSAKDLFQYDLSKTHPVVAAHVQKVINLPRIKEWIATRPKTPM